MIILYDSKETYPWNFDIYDGWASQKQALKTGDYVALGHENNICIERKASPTEIAVNLGKKTSRDRFERELQRAQHEYRKFYIVCEFTIMDLCGYPENQPDHVLKKLKDNNIKIIATGPFLKSILDGFEQKYDNVKVIYAGSREAAQDRVYEIFSTLEDDDLF